jgi:hypothetical protein
MSDEDTLRDSVRLRRILSESMAPLHNRLDTIEKRLFVGNGRPSLQEEIATNRERLESIEEDLTYLRAKKSMPPPEAQNVHAWKAVTAIAIAIATAVGSIWGATR